MQGLVSMIAVSAVLSASLVAGLAATDAAARPKPAVTAAPIEAPSETPAFKAHESRPSTTVSPCAAAWPYQSTACAADGRKVRVIALTGR